MSHVMGSVIPDLCCLHTLMMPALIPHLQMRKTLSHNLLLGELASQLRFPVGQASGA